MTHTRDHLTPQASAGLSRVQLRDVALVQIFLCGDDAVPSPALTGPLTDSYHSESVKNSDFGKNVSKRVQSVQSLLNRNTYNG